MCATPVKLDGSLADARRAGAFAQSPQAAAEGEISAPDIAQAIEDIEQLSAFFATLAQNDPNRYAAALWRGQQDTYTRISRRLSDLSAQGRIRIAALPEGGASRIAGGTIVIDRRLGGLWLPDLVHSARSDAGGNWHYVNLLSTQLLQGLMRLEPAIGRDWFRSHLARSSLGQAPSTGETALVAGFWYVKDKYLRISMLAAGTPAPEPRQILETRKTDLLSEARSTSAAIDRALGTGWGEALWSDWQEYDRQVGQFSSSRSWLAVARRTPARPTAALPPEDSIAAPLPKSKPDALHLAVPPAARSQPPGEDRVARLAAELGESRAESRRREAKLTEDLDAARREAAEFEAKLAANERTVVEIRKTLEDERETRRQELGALRSLLTAEQNANRQEMARLAQSFTAELEASRRVAADLREQLTAARENSRQQLAKLQDDLVAARETDHRMAAQVEEQLAAELDASREKLALIQEQLQTRIESDRKEADLRQARLTAQLESQRRHTAETVARLSAELAASRDEAAQLRSRLAELAADQMPLRSAEPGSPMAETALGGDGSSAVWTLGIVAAVLGLAGLGAAVALWRRTLSPMVQTAVAARRRLDSAIAGQSDPAAQLTPQLVVETLRRGELSLFERQFARLAGLRTEQLQRIVNGAGGENLAIVCRALDIDKLTFASIFLLSQTSRSAEDKGRPRELSRVTAFYDRVAGDSAREVLRQWQNDPALPGVIG